MLNNEAVKKICAETVTQEGAPCKNRIKPLTLPQLTKEAKIIGNKDCDSKEGEDILFLLYCSFDKTQREKVTTMTAAQ